MGIVSKTIWRFVRDFFLALGILILLAIAGWLYIHLRRPELRNDLPVTIDVHFFGSHSTNDYRTTITNREACEAITREFRLAQPVFHVHKPIGAFTFLYADRKTNVVWVSTGTSDEYYTIRIRGSSFRLPDEQFFRVLENGGLDVSKIRINR